MSNDLISRSNFKNKLKSLIPRKISSNEDKIIKNLISIILVELEISPTAYDLDAVIKKIQEEAEAAMQEWNQFDESTAFGEMNAHMRDLEIVRNGGKNGQNNKARN